MGGVEAQPLHAIAQANDEVQQQQFWKLCCPVTDILELRPEVISVSQPANVGIQEALPPRRVGVQICIGMAMMPSVEAGPLYWSGLE